MHLAADPRNGMCAAGTTPNVVTYGAVLSANVAGEEAGMSSTGFQGLGF